MKFCRFCDKAIESFPKIVVEKQPASAQGFFTQKQEALSSVDLEIYECECCGTIQHLSEPVPYYREVIRAVAYSQEMKLFRVAQFTKLLDAFNLTSKLLLEVGCGKGEYLKLFREAGAEQIFGLEFSDQNLEQAYNLEFDIKKGFLDKEFVNPWDLKFDCISCFSFIEHWPDLKTGLGNIRKLLKDNGIFIVEVPNFDFICREGIYSEFTIDHIYYFTAGSLRNILYQMGFEILALEETWHEYILSAVCKIRKHTNFSHIKERQKSDVNDLISFLSKFDKKEVVVWGAGHQSLSLLAMLSAEKFVNYVVDSAKFKQEKFCPATGLKILNPVVLSAHPPKVILIMAAAYSNEVYEDIKANYANIPIVALMGPNGLEVEYGAV